MAQTFSEACDDSLNHGSQFGSDEFSRWCKENNLTTSMSRRGNCYDNVLLSHSLAIRRKKRLKTESTFRVFSSEEAKSDVFEYTEMFYNSKRSHRYFNQMSPMALKLCKLEEFECLVKWVIIKSS